MTKCRNCGLAIDREYKGRGKYPVYCERKWCINERNRARVSSRYYRITPVRLIECPECGSEILTTKTNKRFCTKGCCNRYHDRKRKYADEPELFEYAMRRRSVRI